MSAETVSPITTYFRVTDGLRVRFADTELSRTPWSCCWRPGRRASGPSVASGAASRHSGGSSRSTCPGFGHSDGRPESIAPDASGAFLAGLIAEWGLGAPHVVGPDVGTAAALFLAAKASGASDEPDRSEVARSASRSKQAAHSRTSSKGPVWTSYGAWTPEPTSATPSSPAPRATTSPKSTRTTSAPTTWVGSRNPPASCGTTRNRTRSCATFSRRSPRRPRSSPGAMMTSCHGRTTSTWMTSSRTARCILSTRVTSRGSKPGKNTAAWSPIGSAADIGESRGTKLGRSRPCP